MPHLWEKLKNGCLKIFTTSPVQMFGLQIPQTSTPWIEKDSNRTSSNTKAQLMDKIKTVFEALPKETSVGLFEVRSTFEAVIDANDGYLSESC